MSDDRLPTRPFLDIYLPVAVGNVLATRNIGALSVSSPFLGRTTGVSLNKPDLCPRLTSKELVLPSGQMVGKAKAIPTRWST